MKIFPIVFACDDKYVKYTSVAIASLISNANEEYLYKIYILSQDIKEENKTLMADFIKKYKNFSLEFVLLKDFDATKFYLNSDSYITTSTYYRFYIPELFKEYDRILYLDSDLVIDDDISELMTMDFENNTAIAIQDEYITRKFNEDDPWFPKEYFYNVLKLKDTSKYFNAGVMLFNIKKINEIDLSSLFFDTLFNEIKKPLVQDQDILNSVLTRWGGVKLISNKFNFMTHSREFPYPITYKDIFLSRVKDFIGLKNKDKKDYFIYHFLTSNKPWNSNRSDRLLFYKYLYSIHLVNPPEKFVDEIIKENNRKFPLWWKLFMKFFS